jgi:hypothetical protein
MFFFAASNTKLSPKIFLFLSFKSWFFGRKFVCLGVENTVFRTYWTFFFLWPKKNFAPKKFKKILSDNIFF